MAKWMRCVAGDEVSVTATASEYGRRMGFGAIVDFEEVVTPATGDRPAYTLGDALEGVHHLFESATPEPVAFTPPVDAPVDVTQHADPQESQP